MRGFVGRHPVAIAVLVAMAARLPALTRPIRADEAGFLLVARSWDPQPDSVFGPLWVDRPPLLIGVFDLVDALGGLVTLRLLGVLVAGLVVLLAAAIGGVVSGPRASTWSAALAAALLANPMIDVVSVKGELLALPALLGSILLTLLAVRRASGFAAGSAWWLAGAAGVVGSVAMGLKQNLAGGLIFAAVLLVVSWCTGRLPTATAARLVAAGLGGAAVPVLATIAWAEAAGVRLGTLTETVYGFRTEAARTIADGSTAAPEHRAQILLLVAVGTGMLVLLALALVRGRTLWLADPPVLAATAAVVAVDVAGLVAGGSYWQAYLLPVVPGVVLCAAQLTGREDRAGDTARWVVVGAIVSAALAMAWWAGWNLTGRQEFDEVRTGEAVAAAAAPGDTLVVFGGRADLQWASGLESPYPYLWSLPMRTRDPEYVDLTALLRGPDAPTWLVVWVPLESWGAPGADDLAAALRERYAPAGHTCRGLPVYLLDGLDRPGAVPDC